LSEHPMIWRGFYTVGHAMPLYWTRARSLTFVENVTCVRSNLKFANWPHHHFVVHWNTAHDHWEWIVSRRMIRHVHLSQTVEAGGSSVRPSVKVSSEGFSGVRVVFNKHSCARDFLKPYISGECLVEITFFW
jgi:hypothetical protein